MGEVTFNIRLLFRINSFNFPEPVYQLWKWFKPISETWFRRNLKLQNKNKFKYTLWTEPNDVRWTNGVFMQYNSSLEMVCVKNNGWRNFSVETVGQS